MTIPHFAMTESSLIKSRSVRRGGTEFLVGLASTPRRRRDAIQVLSFKVLSRVRRMSLMPAERCSTLKRRDCAQARLNAQAGAMLTLVV
jgi:hypothetical protein